MSADRSPARRSAPALGEHDFQRLLACFDPDPERASREYNRLRNRLSDFFDRKGITSDELVDRTIEVLAQKLFEGLQVENLVGFAVQIAVRLARGHRPGLPLREELSIGAGEPAVNESRAIESCLRRCLGTFRGPRRQVLVAYCSGNRAWRRARRRGALAGRLGISSTALRIRIHKMRKALEECIQSCLAQRDQRWRIRHGSGADRRPRLET